MRGAIGELVAQLRTRQGFGIALIAVFGTVALGVVPDILRSWTPAVWLLYLAFVVGVGFALAGWAASRDRGLGIVLAMLPQGSSAASRAAVTLASRSSHTGTLVLDRGDLWHGDVAPAMATDRLRLLAQLIDARCAEHTTAGGRIADVALYPLLTVQDAYRLGRLLRGGQFSGLTVTHRREPGTGQGARPSSGSHPASHPGSAADERTLPGVRLGEALRRPVALIPEPLLAPYLRPAADPLVVPFAAVPEDAGYRNRLALVVRLTGQNQMVAEACEVARTGNPLWPDGSPTGYFFDPLNPITVGTPCGAYSVVELADDVEALPDDSPEHFEAVVRHLRTHWQRARASWAEQVGGPVRTVLFLAAPVPVALALAWSLRDESAPVIVNHRAVAP